MSEELRKAAERALKALQWNKDYIPTGHGSILCNDSILALRAALADQTEPVAPTAQQTRLGSLIESLVNIVIGYGVALLSQIAVFPMFDIHVPLSTNLLIGAWFTAISLVRSYIIRRWFNTRIHSAPQTMAKTGGGQFL